MIGENKPITYICYKDIEYDIAKAFQRALEYCMRGQIIVKLLELSRMEKGRTLPFSLDEDIGKSKALVMMLSPEACRNHLVSMIFGLAWSKRVPILSLCHSGLSPENLPFPLDRFPSVKGTDFNSLNAGFPILAEALEVHALRVNSADLIRQIEIHEKKHGFWTKFQEIFMFIEEHNPEAYAKLKEMKTVSIRMTELEADQFRTWLPFLQDQRLLDLHETGYISLHGDGIYREYTVTPLASLHNAFKQNKLVVMD